jgi:hypothetical protein
VKSGGVLVAWERGVRLKKSMPESVAMKLALSKERRSNRRLRTLIAELRTQIESNRRDINLQFARLTTLEAEVGALKREIKRLLSRN